MKTAECVPFVRSCDESNFSKMEMRGFAQNLPVACARVTRVFSCFQFPRREMCLKLQGICDYVTGKNLIFPSPHPMLPRA